MRATWRAGVAVALVAGVAAACTLVVGALVGMHASDLRAFLLFLVPALAATATVVVFAQPLLARATFRQRLVALVLIAAGVAVANLAVLTRLMFVSHHDAATRPGAAALLAGDRCGGCDRAGPIVVERRESAL